MTSSIRPSQRLSVRASHATHADRPRDYAPSIEVNMFVLNVCVQCRALVDGGAAAEAVQSSQARASD